MSADVVSGLMLFKRPLGYALLAAMLQCVACSAVGGKAEREVQHEKLQVKDAARRDPVANLSVGNSTGGATLRPSPASNPGPPEVANTIYLPAESAFVAQHGISASLTDQVIESRDEFARVLKEMSNDEMRSMEAQDLAKLYRRMLERAVGTESAVEDLSCGLSVCMGSVRAGSLADHDAWLARLGEDPAALRYVFMEAIEHTGDQFQSRFVFSTDPALKAIVLN
jgi:hypothetical protein